jgi:hypothetical protein
LFSFGFIQKLFRFVFVPYFGIKLIYQFSRLSGVYFCTPEKWEVIWSIICVIMFIFGLIIILIKKPYA